VTQVTRVADASVDFEAELAVGVRRSVDASNKNRFIFGLDVAPYLLTPGVAQDRFANFEALDIAAHVDSYSTSSGHFPVLAVELVVVQFAVAEGVEPCLGDEDYVGVVEESN
jgi:hypothetical protein